MKKRKAGLKNPPEMPRLLVSPEEHDAGFKVFEVTRRSGLTENVRLNAPTHAEVQQALAAKSNGSIRSEVVNICLPQAKRGLERPFMDQLTQESANQLETVCYELAFGVDFALKVRQGLEQQAK